MEVLILEHDIEIIDWLQEQIKDLEKSEKKHDAQGFLHRIKTNALTAKKLKNK